MVKSKFEEMMDRLPSNIKETEVLRFQSKKLLAALLELLLHSEARESRIIYCQNDRLRKLSGVGADDFLPSIQQLIDYDLITRKVGSGEGIASEYTINIRKLKEPLVEKTFDDLFSEFLEDSESSEMPISTTIPITISTSNTTSITNSISTLNATSTTLQVQEQNQDELERPSSYKELMDYFKNRIEEECKDKTLDELNEIQESLKDELDEFNEINGYQDVYRFFIVPSMERKRERLLDKILKEREAENEKQVSQPVITESQASAPIENLSQASPVKEEIEAEPLPDEEEQYQQWFQVTSPILKELEYVKTPVQFDYVKNKLAQVGSEYLDNHEETSPIVIQRMNRTVGSALRNKKEELTPSEMNLSEYLSRHHNYDTL